MGRHLSRGHTRPASAANTIALRSSVLDALGRIRQSDANHLYVRDDGRLVGVKFGRSPLSCVARPGRDRHGEGCNARLPREIDVALDVWRRDAAIDEMYSTLFRELVFYMEGDPHRIAPATQMQFIARAMERIGDRATNIAEMVRYLLGTPVEEERPKADTTKTIIS